MAPPLENLLVVSLEQAVAAPMCTCRLADAGARVIKIERPDGDFARYYDDLVQGESAYFVWLNRGKESVVLDLAGAEDKVLLEAMLARDASGQGAELSISMFDAMADWMTVPLLQHEGGKPPQRVGLAHFSIAPYGVFKTKDGADILISIQNDREWRVLATNVLDDPALAADPDFATNTKRCERRGYGPVPALGEHTERVRKEFMPAEAALR